MTCACCQTNKAVLGADPRLRWLRLPTCWGCRDRIAEMAGWSPQFHRGGGRPVRWRRGGEIVADPVRDLHRRKTNAKAAA